MKPYKVPTYPVVTDKLPGTELWAQLANKHSGGALWNNGTFVFRDIRGKPGQISNHARGVAMDLSYRYMEARKLGVSDGRAKAVAFFQRVLDNWELLGVQAAIDYNPAPFGRSWRCDRVGNGPVKPHAAEAWIKPKTKLFTGAPGGDWWHIEITLGMALNPQNVRAAFKQVFEQSTTPVQP